MPNQPPSSEQRIVLSKVSWQAFETLLQELETPRSTRLTYDRGRLELRTPTEEHERCNKLLESLILVLVDEQRLPVKIFAYRETADLPASPLLQRQDLHCAIEPDACYYFEDELEMQSKPQINLAQNPPPELAVEIALTHSSFNTLALYSALGVAEVWQYVLGTNEAVLKGEVHIYGLEGDRLIKRDHSRRFPFLPSDRIQQFLEQSDSMGLAKALIVLRDWVQRTTRT